MRPGDLGREVVMQGLQHRVTAFSINPADQFHVLFEEAIPRCFVGNHLHKAAGVEVSALLQLHQPADYIGRRHDPTQSQSRRHYFGVGAEIDDVPQAISIVPLQVDAIEHDQRRNVLAFIAQLPVGVVLDDRDAVLVGEQYKFVSATARQRDASWVLKVRQDVHELRSGTQRPFHLAGLQSVVVDGHGYVLSAHQVESLQCAEVGGRLHQNAIATVDEQLGDEVQRLLRAGGDEDVVHGCEDAVARQLPHNQLAQRKVAFCGAVLQRSESLRGQNVLASFLEACHGKYFRRGQPAAKRDDLGTLGELEQLTNDGTLG